MSDDWQVVEEALHYPHHKDEGLAALARLREREAQQKEVTQKWYDEAHDKRRRVARLEEALRRLALNPKWTREDLERAGLPMEELGALNRRALAHEEES